MRLNKIPMFYNKFPIVFTKDSDFVERIERDQLREGSIVLLPEDAILIWRDNDDTRNT